MNYRYTSSSRDQDQCALGNRTPQIMKKGQDGIIQMGSGTRCLG